MGTRHHITVIIDETVKVSQYGQWDGDLTGQGLTLLHFLQNLPDDFPNRLRQTRFLTEEEIAGFSPPFPAHLSRNTGAKVLMMLPQALVNNPKSGVAFAYTLDFDKRTFSVWPLKRVYSFDALPTDKEFCNG